MDIDDGTVKALSAALKFRQMRQELISTNIANAETPNYKAKSLSFEDALARALDVDGQMKMNADSGRHYDVGNGGFENLAPQFDEKLDGAAANGNTVDRDAELALMAENKIMYDATVQLLNKKLALLKYSIGQEK